MSEKIKFIIIGIDDSPVPEFTGEELEHINGGEIFSGGERHHSIVKAYLPANYKWINITPPTEDIFRQYSPYDRIIVFASGDPLFYGFAATVKKFMPEARIITYPRFNSLQLLSHRLVMPYPDMHVVSLTGRPWNKLDEALISGKDFIGILTDNKEHTPSAIARRLKAYGFVNYKMFIGELLGNKEKEKVSGLTVDEVIGRDFEYPNNIILRKTYNLEQYFGIPDNKFELLNGRIKMITKMPVRLAALSQLELKNKNRFWDIGFCTGSVSIEAKMQFPHLEITAFEIRKECGDIIEKNIVNLHTPGINIVTDDFCEYDISMLKAPEAVFIGGHGGRLKDITGKICAKMTEDAVIVFNSVSQESYDLFTESAKDNNLSIINEINISVDTNNLIKILKAVRK